MSFLFYGSDVHCAQPYFPPQVTFTSEDRTAVYAIDEFNQLAHVIYGNLSPEPLNHYLMKNTPFPIPDSPQAKHYVHLSSNSSSPDHCYYETAWKYGSRFSTWFSLHWYHNRASVTIGNFVNFNSKMIHSTNETILEDYWYSEEKCKIDIGKYYPCEEIYFTKNTDLPLKTVRIGVDDHRKIASITTKYTILSVGKPDETSLIPYPKDWAYACADFALGLSRDPESSMIPLNESGTVNIWLNTPSHRINENDTVIVEWERTNCECSDCISWTPERLVFNIENFNQPQKLTITRFKQGTECIVPILTGGAYDQLSSPQYRITIM
ncbi:unnamed protein product [Rotaria sp. Silwood1]|nr:unnamed protein product [Rotaria sp. Silwood1]CAF1535318.1 unnamed protein product [Rotaria sp. Silwood1]CAF1536016.1 unnamed protein product [Rotaria sp. Silwood1]CAF3737137.1 unnamed protein product [Rotaria sp. Silwood1]CAF4757369.1 unnamed protein product [Rotaria sp. Silwood1]